MNEMESEPMEFQYDGNRIVPWHRLGGEKTRDKSRTLLALLQSFNMGYLFD